jgi:hypothetical protein
MKVGSKFFRKVAILKCMGMTVTNQNCISGNIKSTLNSWTKIGYISTFKSILSSGTQSV